ncbi:MAG: HAD family hydrolase [Sphingomonadales bacterium]|nr:HAD family hydrolase [Sphingomonadales bacterium]
MSMCTGTFSTPAAIATGIATAARHGISLSKAAQRFRNLAKIKIAAFDKTGTLTPGHPSSPMLEGDATGVLRLAAAVETGLSHPVARGIVAEAEAKGDTIPGATDVGHPSGRRRCRTSLMAKIALLSPRAWQITRT